MKILKNQISIFYTFILFVFQLPILSNAQVISKEPENLFVVGSESIHFQSEINTSDYTLHINLPESYDRDPTKIYPVFYALDGYRVFGVTTHIYQGLWDDGFIPEIIIVGITNSGVKAQPTLNRTRDLTPTSIARISTSGGASSFLEVLDKELIPLIEGRYRTDKTNRTLVGTSFAGLFTYYTLFTQPSLFNNYIIHNATLWWDNAYPYQLEDAFYRNNKSLTANVIFLNSEHNDMPNAIKLQNQLESHSYSNLTLGFRMIENMGHLGGEAEAINQGMRFAYKRPTVIIPDEELRGYCGTYKDGTYIREIVIRDGELTLMREGETSGTKIKAISATEFALLGKYFDFRFHKNRKGEILSFSNQFDTDPSRVRTAIKIK